MTLHWYAFRVAQKLKEENADMYIQVMRLHTLPPLSTTNTYRCWYIIVHVVMRWAWALLWVQ